MELNLPPPNMRSVCKNNVSLDGDFNNKVYFLHINNISYMYEDFSINIGLKELKPQIDFAYGHCICTGLGFLLRENYLINKPEVTKVTVIENNQNVIDLQNELNPNIMSKLNIIHDNANLYQGECDCLLLDHFILPEENLSIIDKCFKNINHKLLWWWDITHSYDYQLYISKLKDMFNTLPDLTEEEYNNYLDIRK